jgi:hypothetical protein
MEGRPVLSTDALVVLRGGFSVPARAFVLLLELEARGVRVWRDGSRLIVEPAESLTDEDHQLLPALKPQLLALLDYCTRADLDAHLFTDTCRTA